MHLTLLPRSRIIKEHAFFIAELRSHNMDEKFDQIRLALNKKLSGGFRLHHGSIKAFAQRRVAQANAQDADVRARCGLGVRFDLWGVGAACVA